MTSSEHNSLLTGITSLTGCEQ